MQASDDKRGKRTANSGAEDGHGGPGMDPRRLKRLADVSSDGPSKLGVFRRAYSGVSLRSSVNAFCLECLWLDPGAIRDCDSVACPLWNVRPYQSRTKDRKAPAPAGGQPVTKS